MSRVVIHNTMGKNVGRFRATAPARDRKTSDCGCGCGGAGTCGHDHRDEARQTAQAYVQQVGLALNSFSEHVQRLARQSFQEGVPAQEAVKRIRKSNATAYDTAARDYSKANLSIDVTYGRGPMGREIVETRHYVVPNVLVDPRGHGPQPAAVASSLRQQPGHVSMIKDGWLAKRAEGYFKQEQRELGDRVTDARRR